MLTTAAPHPPPIAVYRTSSRDDARISPFHLDPSSITLRKRHAARRYRGEWLHMPVMVRVVQSREHALRHVHYLSRLRHPNLEQFLGAVVDHRAEKAVITELVRGRSVSEMLARAPISPRLALTIALDAARALVYLHATTAAPHGGIRPQSVVFDHVRSRAVVLLSTTLRTAPPCAAPEARRRPPKADFSADVYSLAALLCQMFLKFNSCNQPVAPHLVNFLPKPLQGVVYSALQTDIKMRPSMEQLCQALTDCHAATV